MYFEMDCDEVEKENKVVCHLEKNGKKGRMIIDMKEAKFTYEGDEEIWR